MKKMCPRGHRPTVDALVGDRCKHSMATRNEVCGERVQNEPALAWCGACGDGLYVDGWCSACGDSEAPHGDMWGCAVCRSWFPTYGEWWVHTYGLSAAAEGSDVSLFECQAPGYCTPQKQANKPQVRGGKTSLPETPRPEAHRRGRQREYMRQRRQAA